MEDLKILNKEKRPLNEDIKFLHVQEMNNLVITHSPSIETDNMLSGEMEKYYFEHSAKCQIGKDKLVVTENEGEEKICLEISDINQVSPISHNDKIVFLQEYVCALLYKDEQVITFYFD